MKAKDCCLNCKYYWLILYDDSDNGFCTIDKQNIPCELSHIFKCKAFKEWFGVVN